MGSPARTSAALSVWIVWRLWYDSYRIVRLSSSEAARSLLAAFIPNHFNLYYLDKSKDGAANGYFFGTAAAPDLSQFSTAKFGESIPENGI